MQLAPATDLTFTRTLNAPRTLLWTCWTTPEHLMQFFMPKPHSLTACKVDLRPGGAFNTAMRVFDTEMENEGVFLEIVEGQRLVFTDSYSTGWKPSAEPFMTAIIEFADAEGGATTYTATARHRTEEARQTHKDMGFYDGWGAVADQLEAYANTLH